MALTAAQTISVYHACGLHAGGTTRYRYKFNAYAQTDVASFPNSWSYATVKTALDTRLAAMSSDENTWIGTHITTYDGALTSSFKKTGLGDGIVLDDDIEKELARQAIVTVVGIEVEPVDIPGDNDNSRCGRVTR